MQSRGAAKQLGRVKHVRGAEFVHVYLQARILADKRASGRSVIQMDVCEQYGAETGKTQAMLFELSPESVKGGSRSGINQRKLVLRAEKSGGNRAWMAGPLKIDRGCEIHGEVSVTQAESNQKWRGTRRDPSAQS